MKHLIATILFITLCMLAACSRKSNCSDKKVTDEAIKLASEITYNSIISADPVVFCNLLDLSNHYDKTIIDKVGYLPENGSFSNYKQPLLLSDLKQSNTLAVQNIVKALVSIENKFLDTIVPISKDAMLNKCECEAYLNSGPIKIPDSDNIIKPLRVPFNYNVQYTEDGKVLVNVKVYTHKLEYK